MRPTRARIIGCIPPCRLFRPSDDGDTERADGPHADSSVRLGLDMLEAMRLVDAEGMSQEAAAQSMGVSAPTLCRILAQGRQLTALALSSGKAINIEGGNIMYRNGMNGCHGQRRGHGHAGRHGQTAMNGAEMEKPSLDERPCRGRRMGMSEGQGRRMRRHGGRDS